MVDRRRHTTQRATSPLRSTEWVSVREEEYRALQEGLAVAQRQLVELSRQHAYEQERYHLRLSQLEQVHSMRETTLKEELALLRRVHQNHLKRWNNAVAAPPDPVEPAPVEHCAAVGRSTTAEKENEHKSLRLHTDIGGGQWNGTGLEANAIRDLVERRRQLLLDAAWMTSHPHQAESLSARPSAAPQPAPPPAWNESASSQEQQRVVWSNLDNTVVENVRRDNGGQYARKVETSSVGEDASASVHLEPHFRVDELPPAGAAVVQAVVGGAWAPHGNLMRSGNYRASAAASVYPVAGGEAPSPLASGRIDANPPSCSVSVHSRLMTSTKPSTGTPHERYDIQEEDIEEARWKSATALGHNEQRPVRARRSISGGSISSLHTHQNESDNAAPTVPLSSATPAIHEPDFYRPVCDELFIAAARQLTHQNRKNQKLKKRTAFAASADDQLPPTPPLRGPQKVAKGHPASRSHSTGNMQEADKEVVKVAQGLWAEHMLSERRMRR